MATWEQNVAAGGIRFPQAWPVAQAESFPSCVSVSFCALWLEGIWRSTGGEGSEWRGRWNPLSVLASGLLPNFPTHSTGAFPLVLGSFFPCPKFNYFSSETLLWASTCIQTTSRPLIMNCKFPGEWLSTPDVNHHQESVKKSNGRIDKQDNEEQRAQKQTQHMWACDIQQHC